MEAMMEEAVGGAHCGLPTASSHPTHSSLWAFPCIGKLSSGLLNENTG